VNTSTLVQKLWSYCLGEPQVHKNLTVYPLLHDGAGEPDYLLLDEAVQRGLARAIDRRPGSPLHRPRP